MLPLAPEHPFVATNDQTKQLTIYLYIFPQNPFFPCVSSFSIHKSRYPGIFVCKLLYIMRVSG